MATFVTCGTSSPTCSSSSAREKTSSGVPSMSLWAWLMTTMRSTFRAISSMEWLTRMMVLPFCSW